MNGSEKQYMGRKFAETDRAIAALHDDVLIIKTERKMEKKLVAVIAGAISLTVSYIVTRFWR